MNIVRSPRLINRLRRMFSSKRNAITKAKNNQAAIEAGADHRVAGETEGEHDADVGQGVLVVQLPGHKAGGRDQKQGDDARVDGDRPPSDRRQAHDND